MKAVLCESFGPPENLSIREVEDPQVSDGEVLIDVCAVGLNFPDVLQINGQYQFQPPLPFTPGAEVGGIVSEVGGGVDHVKVGDRVLGMIGVGGMAEKALWPGEMVFRIPDSMGMPAAAGFMMVYGTSYYALKQRALLQPGETLLVTGAGGGVGYTAIEIGKAIGARVIAAASTQEKLDFAIKAGADETVNYSDANLKDAVKDLTGGLGADVIYDPVGGDIFDHCARCVNWNGRILVIGFASGRIPEYKTNLALLKGASVVGVYWGEHAKREPDLHAKNVRDLFEMFEQGKIKPPVTRVFPLDQYADALNLFVERKARGKVILEVRKEE